MVAVSFRRFWSDVCFFFFSSRRRHTRCYRDWSSDVCSSDLVERLAWRLAVWAGADVLAHVELLGGVMLRSEERREGKSVDLGGRRIIKKKKKEKEEERRMRTRRQRGRKNIEQTDRAPIQG